MDPRAKAVVTFWRDAGKETWFSKNDAFDRDFHDRFLDLHFAAARRELDDWLDAPESALALMILLDQFPRNCFRGTGHMYATDSLALCLARRAVTAGLDKAVEEDLQVFFYLPFMHSEDLADQERSLRLCGHLDELTRDSARDHHAIIEKFGRFPHRNPMLGRDTTPREETFLGSGGFSG